LPPLRSIDGIISIFFTSLRRETIFPVYIKFADGNGYVLVCGIWARPMCDILWFPCILTGSLFLGWCIPVEYIATNTALGSIISYVHTAFGTPVAVLLLFEDGIGYYIDSLIGPGYFSRFVNAFFLFHLSFARQIDFYCLAVSTDCLKLVGPAGNTGIIPKLVPSSV